MEPLDEYIRLKLSGFGWPAEALVDLLMAALAGGLVGLEREVRGRQAGFRTNLLVAVGSALVMVVSKRLALVDWPDRDAYHIAVDPGRIAYGVMTGVGFLGAGTILQNRGRIRGLTTAAALWCVAAIGLAAGLGLYVLTLGATVLVLVALWVLDFFEGALPSTHYRNLIVRRRWERGCIGETVDLLKQFGLRVVDTHFERTADLVHVDIELRVAFREKDRLYRLERELAGDERYQLLAVRHES